MRATDGCDVVVVGAGVVGMSIAWRLAEAGADCMVLERIGVGSGATAVQPGGVRTQWTAPVTCRMAVEAAEFYRDFDTQLRVDSSPGFDPCGYAFVASTEATMTELADRVETQNRLGVPSRTLDAAQLADLVPGLDDSLVAGAAYHDQDGYFDRPGAVVTGFADAAQRCGARVRLQGARRLEHRGDSWSVTLDDGTQVTARRVVVAAGLGSAALVRTTGYELPITAEPRYLFYSNPIKPFLVRPLVVFVDDHLAIKHLADGSVLASDLRHGATGGGDERSWRTEVTAKARRAIPLLEHVRYPTMVEGWYDVTPDAQLMLGPVPGRAGLWVAAGMNGRGLMMAPTVGRMLAASITNPEAAAIPDELLPERFERETSTIAERQVI